MVKRFALLMAFLLVWLVSVAWSTKVACLYYPNVPFTADTCSLFATTARNFFGEGTEVNLIPYDDVWLSIDVDVLYLAGFGSPYGYWRDSYGDSVIPWCDLANRVRAKVLLIDSCYSGEAARCPTDKLLITSTGFQALSVNMPVSSRWGNVSSFVVALYCLTTHEYCQEYVACQRRDPQLCHLQLIVEALKTYEDRLPNSSLSDVNLHPDVQVGVIHLNGGPFREWFR